MDKSNNIKETLAIWAAAFKKSATDALKWFTGTACRRAQFLAATRGGIPARFWKVNGQGKAVGPVVKGTPQNTVAAAKRQHSEWIKWLTIGMKSSRMTRRQYARGNGVFSIGGQKVRANFKNALNKKAQRGELSRMKEKQGLFAAQYNAGINFSGMKHHAKWIERHGNEVSTGRLENSDKQQSFVMTMTDMANTPLGATGKGAFNSGNFGQNKQYTARIFAQAGIRHAETAMNNAVKNKIMQQAMRKLPKKIHIKI